MPFPALIYNTLFLPFVLPRLLALPTPARIGLTLVLLAPLAFLMGRPFPLGWQGLERVGPALLLWAWGVNGCASVLAAPLATLLAMSYGLRAVLFAASALYLLAAIAASLPEAHH